MARSESEESQQQLEQSRIEPGIDTAESTGKEESQEVEVQVQVGSHAVMQLIASGKLLAGNLQPDLTSVKLHRSYWPCFMKLIQFTLLTNGLHQHTGCCICQKSTATGGKYYHTYQYLFPPFLEGGSHLAAYIQ